MRVSRALIGSLGAGVSLAIAGSVALLLVSAVVAFNGWPGAPHEPSVDNVARLTDSGSPSPSSQPGVIGSVQLPAPLTRRSSATRTHVAAHRSHPARPQHGTAPTTTIGSSTPQITSVATSSKTSATPTGAGHVVTKVGGQVADTVAKTTQAVSQAVAPVAPPAGRTLEELGAAGGAAVQQVADGAGKLVP